MTGKNRSPGAAAQVSTGGSLISDSKLQALYITMLQCRLLTERASTMRIKAPAVHPYRTSIGQEAFAAGWIIDLQPGDTVALAPGDSVASLVKGVPLQQLVAELLALRNGKNRAPANAHNVLPATSVLEEQFDAVITSAFANKRNRKGEVVVSFAGVAATTLAPWHNMVTLAAKRKLPIVFAVENNPWAAPSPAGDADDFPQKAKSYGLTGISVDGNDAVAVYRVAYESLDRVRKGQGPVMVEGKTYGDSGRVRRSRAIEREPLLHMERYLKAKKLFKPAWKKQLVEDFTKELKRALTAARKANP